MFWAPDELAGSTKTRLEQLKVENPGILTYMPDELLVTHQIINEARPEDELPPPPAAFEPVTHDEVAELTNVSHAEVKLSATCATSGS